MTAPNLLICSGLDPSGGAGLIADVRVAAMLDTRPVGIITAATIQNTLGTLASVPIDPEVIRQQLETLLQDIEVTSIKIGMVGSAQVAQAIGEALSLTRAPVVWDPVARSSRGEAPLVEGGFDQAVLALAPHLMLITPNAHELALLTGMGVADVDDAIEAGKSVAARLKTAVLVKGGHLGAEDAADYLCRDNGVVELPGVRIPEGERVHGTGCALSTAIAAYLANGSELLEACTEAKRFVTELIGAPVRPGRGAAAVM